MKNEAMEQCPYFETCSAPLCPLDEEDLDCGIWYPDEEICKRRFRLPWLKTQKRIARITSDRYIYFTKEMLERNCIIGSGMKGLDPDKEEEPQLKTWMKKHPPKRQLSDEERKRIKERLKRYSFRKQKNDV